MPMCLRKAYVIHPLHLISIRFFSFAFALKLSPITSSIFICLASLLHSTLDRSFSILFFANFRQFCRFLERMKMDDDDPELWCPFCIRFVYIGRWDRALKVFKLWYLGTSMFWIFRLPCNCYNGFISVYIFL